MVTNTYEVKTLPNSIKFYLPRVEGYLDVVREIASRYGSMSLIEFDDTPGGANDYSNWTYTYNETYHNITPGINELTSKITCYDVSIFQLQIFFIISPY